MARITNILIKEEPQHYTVTIRKTIDFMKEYSDFAEQVLDNTGKYLSKLGLFPISGPIVCFHNIDLESLDVEMGWQIVHQVESKDDMVCNLIPARKIVTAIDFGPYEQQDPTLEDIFYFIKVNGHEPQGPIYYCYLNDTERPESEYLTQMSLPIK